MGEIIWGLIAIFGHIQDGCYASKYRGFGQWQGKEAGDLMNHLSKSAGISW